MSETIKLRSTNTIVARVTTKNHFYSHNMIMRGITLKLSENIAVLVVDLSPCFQQDPDTNTYQDAVEFKEAIDLFSELWLDYSHFERRPGVLTLLAHLDLFVDFRFRTSDDTHRHKVQLSHKASYVIFHTEQMQNKEKEL